MKLRPLTEFGADERRVMFDMYVGSYTMGGQPLWFSTPEQMFEKYAHARVVCLPNAPPTLVFGLAQPRSRCMKLSLVCHDGTETGKRLSIQLRVQLLTTPGWVAEACDKVGWLLRKANTPILRTLEEIHAALDIDPAAPHDRIVLNPEFNVTDKFSYQYTRYCGSYATREILFGRLV